MSSPIGVFDSGVGGLTVLREIHRTLPAESTVYLGDDVRTPYGPRPVDEIRRFTLECLDYLYHIEGVKALVIACHTATATTLSIAQGRYDVPVLGVIEPTARMVAETARGRVGVMATQATVESDAYALALRAANPDLEVTQQACPLLTMLVEAGEFATPRTIHALEGYLRPLRERQVDTVVLGCTHYPFLRPAIQELMGPDVEIVESGPATVAALRALIDRGELEASDERSPVRRLLTTGDSESFRRVASTLWPGGLPEVEVVEVDTAGERVPR